MFKKYPFVSQDGLKDCGPVSLLMIIKYYHGNIGIDSLRELLKTNTSGTIAYNLVEGAHQIGFNAYGINTSLKEINKENIILPCIAHVTIENSYKHYIVIYEINFKKNRILIADPASKIKTISFDEFEKIWNGVLIILYPIKNIPIIYEDYSRFEFIKQLITPYKKILSQIIVLSLFVTVFSIISSFFFKYMVDSINYSKHYILFILIIFSLVHVIKIISDFFRNKLLIYINQNIDLNITMDIFKHIISLPYHYYRNRTTGEILSRMTDLNIVKDMISKISLTIAIDLPLAFTTIIVLYFINSTLFFITIIFMILYIFVVIIFNSIFSSYINKIQSKKAESVSYMVESISGFETVKGLGIENVVVKKFEKKYVKYLKDIFKFNNYANNQLLLKEILNSTSSLLIIYTGIILIMDSTISLGTLITFNALMFYFFEPIKRIIDLNTEFKEANNSLKRVLEIFKNDSSDGTIETIVKGDIQFKNLTYSYDNKNNILNNISFSIKEKSKVAIVGCSGSGKSTLLKILMKYYNIPRDKVNINGIDINDYKEQSIKENITYVSQNEMLFTDSIVNNIKLDKKIDDNDFLEIVNICNIKEIIKNSNLGFNFLIEENGFNISGGEKQRIVLARSLLKKFNILIIDEGMNQIDINQEREILKRIFNKYNDKTIIVISHRLNNLDLFDQTVKIDSGNLVYE